MEDFVEALFNMSIIFVISLLLLMISIGITGAFNKLPENNKVCNCNCCSVNNN